MKIFVKKGLKLLLDANFNPATLLVLIIKKPIHIWLDHVIPDDPEQKQ
jgi:hypothetical protein